MTASLAPLHLVLGDNAAAVLRQAIRLHDLHGDVHCIPDDLGHGPLDDGVARVEYMRRCYQGGFAWTHTATDAFAAWTTLDRQLMLAPRELVIWRGHNVSETMLLAMACNRLRQHAPELSVVELPDTPTGHTHVGIRTPEDLASFAARARPLSPAERTDYSNAFEKLKADPHLRRRWIGDRVVAVPDATFDGLLLAASTRHWQSAARVVGSAMGAANPRDALSDVFLSSRLQALIAEGRIQTDTPPRLLRNYRVRHSQPD